MTDGRSLLLFHRDLRLEDHAPLLAALASGREVVCCVILDPRQLGPGNPYRGDHSVAFFLASLAELAGPIAAHGGRLLVLEGETIEMLGRVLADEGIAAVFSGRDYTPFARRRDDAVRTLCRERGVTCEIVGDALLHEPEEVLKPDGGHYTVFSAFARRAAAVPEVVPRLLPRNTRLAVPRTAGLPLDRLRLPAPSGSLLKGGRKEGLGLLQRLLERGPTLDRDTPAKDDTSLLSAHLKFGTISVREVDAALRAGFGEDHPLRRQLVWRDFFTHVAWHVPRVFGGAFHERYDRLPWSTDVSALDAWKEGRTGFPLVDAGMRQLRETGWMHNRVRMVTASFLVKDLHLDWREGERHFARHLLDYDPAVNNGNWQWAASTGCDAVPYFRVFSPWLQQERFDPECAYVKRWVPEVRDVPATDLHRWHARHDRHASTGYAAPICDHAREAARTKLLYRDAR